MHCSAAEMAREPGVGLSFLCCDLSFLDYGWGSFGGYADIWREVLTKGLAVPVLVAQFLYVGRPRLLPC